MPPILKMWEDEDEVPGLPSMSAIGTMPPIAPTPNNSPFGREMPGALDRVSSHRQAKPDAGDPKYKPSLWQRIAAGAVGGLAGAVNAGGRVRIDPATTQQATSGIMDRGYGRDVRRWEDEGAALDFDVEAAAQRDKIARDAEEMGLRRRTTDAQVASSNARTEAERARAANYNRPKDSNAGMVKVSPEIGQKYGIVPNEKGEYYVPSGAYSSVAQGVNQRPAPAPNPTAASLAAAAAGGDAKADAALAKLRAQRPQRQTASDQRLNESQKIRSIANRILTDTLRQKGTAQNAVENAQKFYLDDPEVSAYRNEVIQELQRVAIAENKRVNPTGGSGLLNRLGGEGSALAPPPMQQTQAPPAPPAAPPPPQVPPATPASQYKPGDIVSQGGRKFRVTGILPDGKLQAEPVD